MHPGSRGTPGRARRTSRGRWGLTVVDGSQGFDNSVPAIWDAKLYVARGKRVGATIGQMGCLTKNFLKHRQREFEQCLDFSLGRLILRTFTLAQRKRLRRLSRRGVVGYPESLV